MIPSRREDPPPTGEELIRRRLDALESRQKDYEAALSASWTWTAASQGADLERRFNRLLGAVETLTDEIEGLPAESEEVLGLRAELAELSDRVAALDRAVGDYASDLAILVGIAELLAGLMGLPGLGDPLASLEAWDRQLREAIERKPK
jgi:Rad3-related DNA helicase